MLLLAYIFLSLSWANQDNEVTFKNKFHVDVKGYWTDRITNSKPWDCKAYSNPSTAGIKLRLKSVAGISYALECKSGEIGDHLDLLVFKNKKQLAKLDSVASAGGDCGMETESQSWMEDMNGDRMMDVVRRSKSKTVPSDCGGGAKPASESDNLEAFFWNSEEQDFKKSPLSEGDVKKFKKKYNFSL